MFLVLSGTPWTVTEVSPRRRNRFMRRKNISGGEKVGAPSSGHKKRAYCTADARKTDGFDGVGGHAGGSTDGEKPKIGGISAGGGKVHHAAPRAKENVSPKTARDYGGFSGVGGAPKSTNEY